MGKQSPPPPPNYAAAAQATGDSNLAVAKYTTGANRVNQIGPSGSLTYSKSPSYTPDLAAFKTALSQYQANPYDARFGGTAPSWDNTTGSFVSGNRGIAPTQGMYNTAEDTWTATQAYSPEQQKLFDQQQQQSLDLGGLASQGIDYAKGLMANPTIDESKLAQMPQNAGMSTQQAMMARMAPQQERERAGMDTQLANQGIMQGSEAWKNAKEQQTQGFNDQQNQAALAGINVDMAARNQGIANQSSMMNQPLNMINALRTGSQVTPQNYVNAPQMATPAGTDYSGATQGMYNAQVGNVNAANAQNAGMWSGIGTLAGAAMMSDRRAKKKIKLINTLENGLNIYEYYYKPEFNLSKEKQIGVMADEAELIYPDSVIIGKDGYKRVDYSKLGFKYA